jgi:hypothetical protein
LHTVWVRLRSPSVMLSINLANHNPMQTPAVPRAETRGHICIPVWVRLPSPSVMVSVNLANHNPMHNPSRSPSGDEGTYLHTVWGSSPLTQRCCFRKSSLPLSYAQPQPFPEPRRGEAPPTKIKAHSHIEHHRSIICFDK